MTIARPDRSGNERTSSLTAPELVVGGGAFAMGTVAFAAHLVAPNWVADHYRWPRERWYQREIGAFNAGLASGLALYGLGRREEAFVGSWTVAALLVALTRASAWITGDRRDIANARLVAEDAALAAGGLALLARRRRTTMSTVRRSLR